MTDTKTKAEPKLSIIPRGYWRNRWRYFGQPLATIDGVTFLGDGTALGYGRFVSAEIAEQAARKVTTGRPWQAPNYLGAVFFPEEAQ